MLTDKDVMGTDAWFSKARKAFSFFAKLGAITLIYYFFGGGIVLSAQAEALFQDEFDGPLSTQWDVYIGSASTASGWAYIRGHAPLIFGLAITKADIPSNNYKLTTRFVTENGGRGDWYGGDLYFNVHNPKIDAFPGSFYYLHILTPAWADGQSYETNSLVLGKHVGSEDKHLCGWYPSGTPEGLLNDFDNKVQISLVGGHFEIWINDRFAFSCDDSDPIVGGKIGITSQWEGINRWDYVRVDSASATNEFNVFNPRAELKIGPKANDDSYWVRGWLKLANASNGIDPLTEAVTIKVGPFSHTLPAGSFVQDGSAYSFKGPVGSSVLDVQITGSSIPGGYSFKSCLKKADLEATTMKPQVQLTIGDDQGQAALDVGHAKFGTGKHGQNWVFPPAK